MKAHAELAPTSQTILGGLSDVLDKNSTTIVESPADGTVRSAKQQMEQGSASTPNRQSDARSHQRYQSIGQHTSNRRHSA